MGLQGRHQQQPAAQACLQAAPCLPALQMLPRLRSEKVPAAWNPAVLMLPLPVTQNDDKLPGMML